MFFPGGKTKEQRRGLVGIKGVATIVTILVDIGSRRDRTCFQGPVNNYISLFTYGMGGERMTYLSE